MEELNAGNISGNAEQTSSDHTATRTEESLFENISTCTQLVWKELCIKQAKTKMPRTIILDAIVIILMIMYSVLSHDIIYSIVLVSICIVFNFVEFLFIPTNQAKMAYKRAMDLYRTDQTYESFIYQDHIFVKNVQTKGELDITYDKIAALLDTKHTYLLKLKQKQFLMIQKDGFTKGTMLDFVSFIESKGIPRKF